jgi:RNA polymerase primary sigma factor
MSEGDRRRRPRSMLAYLREVDATPLLTPAEERALALRIAEGDPEARDHLVRANLRLVVRIAADYRGRGLDLDDLVAQGNLGLIRATETFDPDFGARFSTYAAPWIKQSIRSHLIDRGRFVRLPSYAITLLTKWRRASEALADRLGREPGPEEIGHALGLSRRRLRIALETIEADHLARHQEAFEEEGGSRPELIPADGRTEAPEDVLAREEERSALMAGVDRLGEREATILRLRFGLGSAEPLTLQAIGARLGLTRERVRQLERKALSAVAAGLR